MQLIHRQSQLTTDFYTITVRRRDDPIVLRPPVGHEDEFYDLLARSQVDDPTYCVNRPAPSPATYEYFCRHLPEILRGSLPNWRLIEVGVNSDSVLMFKYEHRQTQSLYHLFALPPQSFSFLLELPHTEYGPTPPCQISSYYWGSATGYELCVAITEYFGTFTRHTQLVPTLDATGDYATLLDITEIRGY